jgi:hypothetical protein
MSGNGKAQKLRMSKRSEDEHYSFIGQGTKILYCGCARSGKSFNLGSLAHILKAHDYAQDVEADEGFYKESSLTFLKFFATTKLRNLLKPELIEMLDEGPILLCELDGDLSDSSVLDALLSYVDVVVFVADSSPSREPMNINAMEFLKSALGDKPIVLQYNKRDLPVVLPYEVLERDLNSLGAPSFETSSFQDAGIITTFFAAWSFYCARKLDSTFMSRPSPIEEQPCEPRSSQSSNSGSSLKDETANLSDVVAELHQMVGLQNVKQDVLELVNFVKVQSMRTQRGLEAAPISRHLVFYGNPGTGKTAVARLIAKIYRALGILSTGHLIEVDRAGLVAGYLGQTAIKVKTVVDSAIGGVLFIDEAYTLVADDRDSFGQEAIDTLLKMMEDNRDNLVVIVAGYPGKMANFINSNPGLRSRFNRYLNFDDYTPEELVSIFGQFTAKSGYRLESAAEQMLQGLFELLYNERNESFGNARDVRNLFERAITNQASRIVSIPNIDINDDALLEIIAADIPSIKATI